MSKASVYSTGGYPLARPKINRSPPEIASHLHEAVTADPQGAKLQPLRVKVNTYESRNSRASQNVAEGHSLWNLLCLGGTLGDDYTANSVCH